MNQDMKSAGAPNKDEGNQGACGVRCATIGCTKSCCKANTIEHQTYGIHACSEHK